MSKTNKPTYAIMAKVFRKVSEAFRDYTKELHGQILMGLSYIEASPVQGTSASVSGWLAHYYQTTTNLPMLKGRGVRSNIDGAHAFVKDLGFEHGGLQPWMHEHPEVWGNEYGGGLLFLERAYDSTPEYLTLCDVARWWDRVADKLEGMDEEVNDASDK